MNNVQSIEKIFAGRLLQIPNYQRGYAWEQRQWEEFLEDLELLEDGKEHYTGTLVLDALEDAPLYEDEEGSSYEVFDIVDGQQRLTTTVILLDAIRRVASKSNGLQKLAQGIEKRYISVTAPSGQPIYKLRLNEDSHRFFVDKVLSDNPILGGSEISAHERLLGAKNHFLDYLARKEQELGVDYDQWLRDLHRKITSQLKVSLYNVEDSSEVGVIFEVMNNRGKPLSEMEKVKNYLLYLGSKLSLPDHDFAGEVNRTWANVFRSLMRAGLPGTGDEDQLLRVHWLMAYDPDRRKWDGSKSIKDEFSLKRERYRNDHRQLLTDLVEYTRSLDNASVAYCDVIRPNREGAFSSVDRNPDLREQLRAASEKLTRVRVVATFLPLLVATRLRCRQDESRYLDMVRLCEVFAFRVYRLLEWRSYTGEPMIRRLAYQLYAGEVSLEAALERLRAKLLDYCPTSRFNKALSFGEGREDWYHWAGLKYFLYEYEEHLAGGRRRDVRLPWEVIEKRVRENTIEHILPQTPTDQYWTSRFNDEDRVRLTHDLGNLCLTYDNSSYGNKPFPNKKGGPNTNGPCYWNSVLFQEHELADLNEWNKEELLKRRQRMVEWALRRWHVEEVVPTKASPDDEEEALTLEEEDNLDSLVISP